MTKYLILKTTEFEQWLNAIPQKIRAIVLSRLDMIAIGHFGDQVLLLQCMEEIKMAKIAISKKQRKSGTKSLTAHVPFASPELKNPRLVSETLLECIRTGDLDSFRDVLVAYLMTANKASIAKKAGLGRRTLYDIMDSKKKFNPQLSTVSAVIQALTT